MFLCNDPYTRRYEIDVLHELRADGVGRARGGVECRGCDGRRGLGRCRDSRAGPWSACLGAASAPTLGLCFPYAVFAQVFAFTQSLALGLKADLPNAQGVVNRVVQGFSIYPWDPA